MISPINNNANINLYKENTIVSNIIKIFNLIKVFFGKIFKAIFNNLTQNRQYNKITIDSFINLSNFLKKSQMPVNGLIIPNEFKWTLNDRSYRYENDFYMKIGSLLKIDKTFFLLSNNKLFNLNIDNIQQKDPSIHNFFLKIITNTTFIVNQANVNKINDYYRNIENLVNCLMLIRDNNDKTIQHNEILNHINFLQRDICNLQNMYSYSRDNCVVLKNLRHIDSINKCKSNDELKDLSKTIKLQFDPIEYFTNSINACFNSIILLPNKHEERTYFILSQLYKFSVFLKKTNFKEVIYDKLSTVFFSQRDDNNTDKEHYHPYVLTLDIMYNAIINFKSYEELVAKEIKKQKVQHEYK